MREMCTLHFKYGVPIDMVKTYTQAKADALIRACEDKKQELSGLPRGNPNDDTTLSPAARNFKLKLEQAVSKVTA